MPEPDVQFLAEQQERILREFGDMRSDLNVLIALINRLDSSVAGLTGEVRALSGLNGRSRLSPGMTKLTRLNRRCC